VVLPVGNNLRELSKGAQLQTFSHPAVSKSFLYNAFMAKSGAQTLTFKSMTNRDRQTDKQKDKNSTFLAAPAAAEIQPYQTWHGDRGPRARSCTSKTFGRLTHSFAARGR